MKPEYSLALKFGLIVVMLGLLIFQRPDAQSISISISIVMTMLLVTFFRLKNPEKYKVDERMMKLSGYATSWSWMITLVVVTLLYWNNYIGMFEISSGAVITTVFLVMVISIVALRAYFLRKGDIHE